MKPWLILLVAAMTAPVSAQNLVVESKANLTLTFYNSISPQHQADYINNSPFPALLSRMQSATSVSLQYTRKIKGHFWAGARVSSIKFYDWSGQNIIDFRNAELDLTSGHISLVYRTLFHEKGTWNKLSLFGAVSPGLYQIKFKEPGTVSTSVQPGAAIEGGAEYAVTNSLGLKVSGGYHYVSAHSPLYEEKRFAWSQISVGVILRMIKNRHYLQTRYE